jgi:hypothetical protein
MTTLAELADAVELQLEWVGSVRHQNSVVTWAHATELLNPTTYLRGGELVCTVGTALADASSYRQFVDAVQSSRAVGICFGVGDVHAQVPELLVRECASRDVPLLAAAFGAPFLAINEYLVQRRTAQESLAQMRERTGQLLMLVADRLASPRSLEPALAEVGLAFDSLVFSIWPAGACRRLEASADARGTLLAETPQLDLAIAADFTVIRNLAEGVGVVCGYSSEVALGDAVRGIGEARAAFEIARQGNQSVGPESLTSLDGLLLQQPQRRLQPFVDQLIRPLLEHDRERNTHLLATLRTFLDNDGSLVLTARTEFLHVNTVRHRLERIAEITGKNPSVFSDRTALAIALWAHANAV